MDLDVETGEIVGNAYLFLKEQLELSAMPLPSGITHGTIISMLAFYLHLCPFKTFQFKIYQYFFSP